MFNMTLLFISATFYRNIYYYASQRQACMGLFSSSAKGPCTLCGGEANAKSQDAAKCAECGAIAHTACLRNRGLVKKTGITNPLSSGKVKCPGCGVVGKF